MGAIFPIRRVPNHSPVWRPQEEKILKMGTNGTFGGHLPPPQSSDQTPPPQLLKKCDILGYLRNRSLRPHSHPTQILFPALGRAIDLSAPPFAKRLAWTGLRLLDKHLKVRIGLKQLLDQ